MGEVRLTEAMTAERTLPADGTTGALAARVWRPDLDGPSIVAVRSDGLADISARVATMRDLAEAEEPAAILSETPGERIGTLEEVLSNTPEGGRDTLKPWLLAPVDLQAVKAAGVTFPKSMLERVIEEKAQGAPENALAIRNEINARFGGDLSNLVPGSPEALALKETLIAQGAWSQYLEVGIGIDAEIFTKAQPMAAIGHGMLAGLHPRSTWNNPEPEVALIIASDGRIVGATLGNDVNLRDFEGRSALLLSKAKDNNASAAVGPFIRFFDSSFTLDHVRRAEVDLNVVGDDGFTLTGRSSMSEIARDPADLASALIGDTHQYPDGAVLYLGTMFAPTEDRGEAGMGFTHKIGDVVTISTPALGSLTNVMTTCDVAPRWTFGAADLMRNLARRGLLQG